MEVKKLKTPENWLSACLAEHSTGGRPWVTLAYAQSLDGSITARRGAPTAISGSESMALTHRLRAAHQAILVGIGTILADNPRLTVRLAEGQPPQPVILDSALRCPEDAAVLFQSKPPWFAARFGASPARQAALESRGARVLHLPSVEGNGLSLPALLDSLGELGIRSLMVEGGASVLTAFLRQRLADGMILTIAPRLLGGQSAILAPVQIHLVKPAWRKFGDDRVVWGKLRAATG